MIAPDEGVRTARFGRVLVVTLSRPGKRNAINRNMADQLDAALSELDDDPGVWAGVLQAEGPVFSAGSDLNAGGDYVTERGGAYGIIRRSRRKPLIAAVEGPALGGGFEIVLACDLVVACATASFGLPEVKRGLIPNCGGLMRGPRAMPLNLARELVLTGDPIDAIRAYALGFVNTVTAPGRASAAALELANRICANGPLAVQAALVAINETVAGNEAGGWSATERAHSAIAHTADRAEGVNAFLAKRAPHWTAS